MTWTNTAVDDICDSYRRQLDEKDKRIAELEAALRGILQFTHADEHRVFLRRGIGTDTASGKAWLAVFAALGEPIKSKR